MSDSVSDNPYENKRSSFVETREMLESQDCKQMMNTHYY